MARGKKLWIKDYLFLVMWFFKFMFYFSVLIDDECSSDLTKKAKYAFEALAISCIRTAYGLKRKTFGLKNTVFIFSFRQWKMLLYKASFQLFLQTVQTFTPEIKANF